MRAWLACLIVLCGCGGDPASGGTPSGAPAGTCDAPDRVAPDGTCLAPGVQDDGCAAGTTMASDGTCAPAGITACGEGFAADGDGCEPVLPTESCAPGEMALPGETACAPVMECGPGTWGDLPVDGSTTYVDGAYAGGDSDGTEAKPWTTIGQAVAAAPAGGLVAVAAGSYTEDVVVTGKPVRLWGACPGEVELVGVGDYAALYLYSLDGPAEVGGLAITGPAMGLIMMDVPEVLVDRVWIHDTARRGLEAEDTYGPATMTVRHSLVEATRRLGLSIFGATAIVEDTVVRDTMPLSGTLGTGLAAFPGPDSKARSDLTVTRAVVERSYAAGVTIGGSTALLERLVIRDTQSTDDGDLGLGLSSAASNENGEAAEVTLRASVIANNRNIGATVSGASLRIEDSVIRDTQPIESDGLAGWGIAQFTRPTLPSTLSVTTSVVARNHTAGIISFGGLSVEVTSTIVRDTLPKAADGLFGRGIDVADHPDTMGPPELTVAGSAILRNPAINIFMAGATATVTGTAVAGGGRGVQAQAQQDLGTFGTLTLAASTITDPATFGVVAYDAAVTMIDSAVEGITPNDAGDFGDGVNVTSELHASTASLERCRITQGARAGLSNFGSHAAIGGTALRCHSFDLDGEDYAGLTPSFDNQGDNLCGCEEVDKECKAVSAGLQAPAAVGVAPEESGG